MLETKTTPMLSGEPFLIQRKVPCPLCDATQTLPLQAIDVPSIVRDWKDQYNIDVSDEFADVTTVELVRCEACDLQYYDSENLAGSSNLYSQLEKLDWYYLSRKWEYDIAMQDLQERDRVLEVGCGRGEFVERMQQEHQIEAQGIELNPLAVREAQDLGRPVRCMQLEDVLQTGHAAYDAVCCFQVLEHVPHPGKFISDCLSLLKPGGRLLLGVPNSDGFIGLETNDLLNQPPHHVSRWSRCVLENLTQHFPLALRRIHYEPLASYHLEYFFRLQQSRLPQFRFLNNIARRSINGLALPLMRWTGWYRYFRGHSIYVSFEKVESPLHGRA